MGYNMNNIQHSVCMGIKPDYTVVVYSTGFLFIYTVVTLEKINTSICWLFIRIAGTS